MHHVTRGTGIGKIISAVNTDAGAKTASTRFKLVSSSHVLRYFWSIRQSRTGSGRAQVPLSFGGGFRTPQHGLLSQCGWLKPQKARALLDTVRFERRLCMSGLDLDLDLDWTDTNLTQRTIHQTNKSVLTWCPRPGGTSKVPTRDRRPYRERNITKQ